MINGYEWVEEKDLPGYWSLARDRQLLGQVQATAHGATWRAGKWSSGAPSVEEAMRQATFHVKNADQFRGAEKVDQAQLRATAEALEWVDDPEPDP